MESVIPFTMTE